MFRKLIVKILNVYQNRRSSYYLRRTSQKTQDSNKSMKIAFIVFEPETWDKLEPVYLELKKRKNTVVDLLIVPSFDQELKLTTHYGKELDFFKKIDEGAIQTCDNNGKYIDIRNEKYDYVFYQDPYNQHMPKELRSDYVVKFSKICYIPYGYSGASVFNNGNTNISFFRNIYWGFIDIPEVANILYNQHKNNCLKGYQHFEVLGYPVFDKYYKMKWNGEIKSILWTPRWSYAPGIGGSHFIEYKDAFVKLKDDYPNHNFGIRPHPMMFANLINEGRLSEKEKFSYIENLDDKKISISSRKSLYEEFEETDVLITDYSSIIPMFFLTKKPIIYCPADITLNSEYKRIAEGMYIAENWDEVKKYMNEILNGNDYLKEKRIEIAEELMVNHENASVKIVDTLFADYKKSSL